MQFETAIINALKFIDMPPDIIPIFSDRDGVEPRAPYLLINIINTSNVGLPRKSVSHSLSNTVETIFQVKEIYVGLTFHASTIGNTHDWVQHFDTGLQSDMYDWAFTQQGLGLVESDGVMYQPQPISGKNYKNAIINLTFRSEIIDDYFVNGISRVSIVGNLGIENKDAIVIDKNLINT